MIEEILGNHEPWFLIIAIPAGILIPVLIMYLVFRMMRKKLEPLAQALGGETIISFLEGPYVRLLNYGNEIRIGIRSGSQNSPPHLILKQMTPLGFDLTITRENIATRKLEKWGILKEVKIGEPLFDNKYLIRSSEPLRAQSFLQDYARRELVDYFFNNEFSQLQADKNAVIIRKAGYSDEDLEPENIRSHLDQIQKLATQ
jgi:hypothetical protein